MKVLTIVGARPQFVKAAVLSHAFCQVPGVQEVMVHTGQHYDANLSEVFFSDLEMAPASYNLGIGSSLHGDQTGRMLQALEPLIISEMPDWMVVYGDTNSTLAGALVASKLCLRLAHVEAGLRSFDRCMPEEINRKLTDHVSDLLFTPTQASAENLRREGIDSRRIHLVGDVMYDAALHFGSRAERRSHILEELRLDSKEYILATVHRAENTNDIIRLAIIMTALQELASRVPVVFPVHPRTQKILHQQGMLKQPEGPLRLIEPVGYLDMVKLEKNAQLVITDSGGVQKEAFFHLVPCVTLRETTEWTELVDMGWNRVVPPLDATAIIASVDEMLASSCRQNGKPYGDGHSAQRIVELLLPGICRTQKGQSSLAV